MCWSPSTADMPQHLYCLFSYHFDHCFYDSCLAEWLIFHFSVMWVIQTVDLFLLHSDFNPHSVQSILKIKNKQKERFDRKKPSRKNLIYKQTQDDQSHFSRLAALIWKKKLCLVCPWAHRPRALDWNTALEHSPVFSQHRASYVQHSWQQQ